MKLLSFLLVVFFCFNVGLLYSQSSCPPDSTEGCDPWQVDTLVKSTTEPTCDVVVEYKWRLCGNEYQIHIINTQKVGNCEEMGEMWNDPEYISSFNEWLNLVILEEVADLQGHPAVPPCPNFNLKAIFYTASCGIWVKCTYTIDPDSGECDPDWLGGEPYYDEGGESKVDYWKYQPCGETCCKKTYSICEQAGTHGAYIEIELMEKVQIGDCSNPEGFQKECINGC